MATKTFTLPVSEDCYAQTMLNTVEPYLLSCGEHSKFKSFDNNLIAYEKYTSPNATANVVIVHGFTESAEKFREMSYCFCKMGYNVFAIDNRGHANSYRENSEPEVVHIASFDEYIKDLDCFIKSVVTKCAPNLPLFLYCHSMGGAIGVQYLQEHQGVFKKAVLSAPMICPYTKGIPTGVTAALTKLFICFGKQKNMVFMYSGFNPNRTYEQSHDTSKARFDYYQAKRCNNALLQTASPSYRWVSESVKVIKKNLNPERCKKIDCEVLLCQPEEDTSVVSEKEDEFILLVKNGQLVKFKNCRHEIYMSIDSTMQQYLDTIYSFFEQ